MSDLDGLSDETLEALKAANLDQAQPAPSTSTELQQTPSNTATDDLEGLSPEMRLGVEHDLKEEKYGTLGQKIKTGLEGIATGIAGPPATLAETALGIAKPEDILARREVNPVSHYVPEIAGLVGSALTGVGLGAALGKVGAVAGVGAEAVGLGKLGSAIVKTAAENAVFQGSDEVSKFILGDPNQSVQTAATDMGLALVIGGVFGGGGEAASALWKATSGNKTAGVLKAIANKFGGIEGVLPEETENVITQSGIDVAPELKSAMSNDPKIQGMAKTLLQSDTTSSGRQLQKTFGDFQKQAGDAIVDTFGKTPEEINAMGDISKYEAGKSIGKTLADEYETQLTPIAKDFEKFKTKFKDTELVPDVTTPTGEVVRPGTMTQAAEKISKMAIDDGWAASPSSDIMKEVNRVLKELPLQKNIKNLGDYITQVGSNTSDPLNGSLRRAGGMIKSVLRDAESAVLAERIGKEQGQEAVDMFNQARASYSAQSALKDAINDRLHIRGSNTSNFAKGLREMAQTDGETLLNRISGKGDANLLEFLQKNYPQTANSIRDFHIDSLLKSAADKATPEMTINSQVLLKNLKGMSPELRSFIANPESVAKIQAISDLLDKFKFSDWNHSNSARVVDKLTEHGLSSATGLIAGIASHSPGVGILTGILTKVIGKDIPDAIKLGLLKFLGSGQPVSAEGFKNAVELINHTIKGENLVSKAAKNVFKSDSDVLPASATPSMADKAKLDKLLKTMQNEPGKLMEPGQKAAYYMPEHGMALTATAVAASQFINSLRPENHQQNPLDTKIPISPLQKAEFDNTLSLAQQPLLILQRVKEGTITPKDISLVKTAYPQLYNRLVQKLSNELNTNISKGESVPYKTRIGLSLFMGQPMDSTMTPQGIMSAQQANMPLQPPQMPQDRRSHGRPSSPALNKVAAPYRTPGQSAEARRSEIK